MIIILQMAPSPTSTCFSCHECWHVLINDGLQMHLLAGLFDDADEGVLAGGGGFREL